MATVADRRRAQVVAGKARRKKIFAIAGLCVLVLVLVIQVPKTLDLLASEEGAVAPVPVDAATLAPPATTPAAPRALRLPQGSGQDPFVMRSISSGEPGPVVVAGPEGARDPFLPTPSTEVLAPKRIVIGIPTPGSTPTVGYIVVLASIRAAAGRVVADRIARTARSDGLAPVGVLDSSTRRPLRAGYYVAYVGPFRSGSDARDAAEGARTRGYRTAYIRELVRY